MSANAKGPKATFKRDALKEIEEKYQQRWEDEQIFKVDAPDDSADSGPKYLVTFPFIYINGRPHLGHAFTLSKAEFAVSYWAMKGRRAIFPFGFHATGMPIKASADKLQREIELYGRNFEEFKEDSDAMPSAQPCNEIHDQETNANVANGAPRSPKQKKKIAMKTGGKKYQFQIMESLGIPRGEIAKFADTATWLEYFPPKITEDLKAFGAQIDWRRSFLTTQVNPYYDSFVQWQFRKLKKMEKVKFGEKYTIWSPKDGQACMDHDRASGEGLFPQEYTGIKLDIDLEHSEAPELVNYIKSNEQLRGKRVFLLAATLRPETMYGQTNLFISRNITYGFFEMNTSEVVICTYRAARNMAYQGLSLNPKEISEVGQIKGEHIVGAAVRAPLSRYQHVFVLPMDHILSSKGTGVVTSVPSDSPDDWAMLADLKKKPAYYGIKPSWVERFNPTAVIKTPSYGEMSAQVVCKQLKIASPNDKAKLSLAKDMVYKEGFYKGTMIVGTFKGMTVQETKDRISEEMICAGDAVKYVEPEGQIISRSGDECVVCLANQWFLDYGDPGWKQQTKKCLAKLNTYHEEARNAFSHTLDWLHEWACARAFGLGTKLPWDHDYLIESLSDSTIYMAYYTIAHLLQADIAGTTPGELGIRPEQLSDEVWDYIFLPETSAKPNSDIPDSAFRRMRQEFEYFYPVDMRVSGKDLIRNHLTFSLYIHNAIFPEKHWPRSFRANGHLLLNSEKMSKNTGNFLTLADAISQYGADATRIALADASDSIEDANFVEAVANAQILNLYRQKEWFETVICGEGLREGGSWTLNDKYFHNALNRQLALADAAYVQTNFRDALKHGFFDLQAARDWYRESTQITGEGMLKELVERFMELQALLLGPIAPHWSDHIWRDVLGNTTTIRKARIPSPEEFPADPVVLEANEYLRKVLHSVRTTQTQEAKKRKKTGAKQHKETQEELKKVTFLVCSKYTAMQQRVVAVVRPTWDPQKKAFHGEMKALARASLAKDKKVMAFLQELKEQLPKRGTVAFDRGVNFDEKSFLEGNEKLVKGGLSFNAMEVLSAEEVLEDLTGAYDELTRRKAEMAMPGFPGISISWGPSP